MKAALRLQVYKEIRALLPAWLASVAVVGAVGLVGDFRLYSAALAGYVLGAIALGALSIGHEYSGRTLALLLSQPADRRRLYLIKLAAVMVLLLTLGAVGWASLSNPRVLHVGFLHPDGPGAYDVALLVLPLLAGVCVAPVLTMMCRSSIAGMVFTLAVLAFAIALGEAGAVLHHGWALVSNADLAGDRLPVVWRVTIGLSILAAASSWRLFSRLEAIDGRNGDIHLPHWLHLSAAAVDMPGAPPAPRRPLLWQLARKELHLQQMTFVVGAIYVLCWGVATLFSGTAPQGLSFAVVALPVTYGPLLALLAGSLASAEERQFGTLEWQLLLPVAASKQWAVKAGTALGLALVLGLALPLLLAAITAWSSGAPLQRGPGNSLLFVPSAVVFLWLAGVVVPATVGLYVSSLSTSGVRALMLSLPALLGLVLFVRLAQYPAWRLVEYPVSLIARTMPSGLGDERGIALIRTLWSLTSVITGLLVAGFVALVLRFALVNHRSVERHAGRVWRQAFWAAGSLALGTLLLAALSQLPLAILMRNRAERTGVPQRSSAPAQATGSDFVARAVPPDPAWGADVSNAGSSSSR